MKNKSSYSTYKMLSKVRTQPRISVQYILIVTNDSSLRGLFLPVSPTHDNQWPEEVVSSKSTQEQLLYGRADRGNKALSPTHSVSLEPLLCCFHSLATSSKFSGGSCWVW